MDNKNWCSICLGNGPELVAAVETDTNDIKWSCKLRFCVPEVEWNEDCSVCQLCRTQLNTFCTFRNRCLEINGFNNRIYSKTLKDCNSQCCTCSLCNSTIVNKNNRQTDYTCYICNKIFSSKTVLIRHIKSHSSNSCSFCDQNFVTKTQLQLHVARTHKETVTNSKLGSEPWNFDCSNNSEDFTENKNDLGLGDVKIVINDIKLSEYVVRPDELKVECYNNSNDATSVSINEDDGSNDISFNMVEKNIFKIASKCQKQPRKTNFICEKCQNSFISSKKLVNHAIRIHGFDPSDVKPFGCDKCDRKFSTSSNLLQHKKYHVGKRTHICTFCGKGFITKSDLNTHEKQHLNKREYQCVTCPKTFNTNKDLRSHRLVVHTDSSLWNYVCTFCEKRFPIKSNLDQHMRRHTGEKRFGCHICEKRFVDKIVLQKHIKSHSNFRAFKCEHCFKEYKDNRVLEVHMTKIHGIGNAKIPVRVKKYFCHACPKSYFAKNKLTRHIFSHTGERPFQCHICERKFTDKSYVKQHLKTAHNIL